MCTCMCSYVCMYVCVKCVCFIREENDSWVLEDKLEAHTDWVRDVAWAPSVGLPSSRIASCSQVRVRVACGDICNSMLLSGLQGHCLD